MSFLNVNLNDPSLRESLARKVEMAKILLWKIADDFAPAALANSLSAEDMVLTDLIDAINAHIEIFSLDTGRLPPETYELMAETKIHYGFNLKLYYPRHDLVEAYTRSHGINAFYESVEQRKGCCFVRKIEPLRRALAGKRAWITGMRAEQSLSRQGLGVQMFDETNSLEKFNPLADWSNEEVWAYIKKHKVPYNTLYDRSYPSIGCLPCTRAVSTGGDLRSGRWWWEQPDSKEFGFHGKDS